MTKSLQADLPENHFRTWFRPTSLKELDAHLALVEVPNKFIASWLRDHYIGQIRSSFKKNLNLFPEIRFVYPEVESQSPPTEREAPSGNPRLIAPRFDPKMTFSNFIVGEGNRFAFTCAKEVTERPGLSYNPLCIFSKGSLGKTHLLTAIAHETSHRNQGWNIVRFSARRFSNECTQAIRRKTFDDFMDRIRRADVLLLDDIHQLGGRDRAQETLISLFNTLHASRKQLVITSTAPPSHLSELNGHLRSRLGWGLLAEIHIPDLDTKIKIIQQKAERETISIPEDVVFFLANTSNDFKALFKNLIRIEANASLYHRKIDISMAKSLLKAGASRKVGAEDIKKATAAYFNLPPGELISSKRGRAVSYPRHVAMYLCRKMTKLSFKEIGEAFGRKDHSTVIYAVQRIDQEKKSKKDVTDDLQKLETLIS